MSKFRKHFPSNKSSEKTKEGTKFFELIKNNLKLTPPKFKSSKRFIKKHLMINKFYSLRETGYNYQILKWLKQPRLIYKF